MDERGKTRRIKSSTARWIRFVRLRRWLPDPPCASREDRYIQVDGRDGPANENRLCVKGRFGYDYAMSPERLTKPLIRRDGRRRMRRSTCAHDPLTHFREATWEEAHGKGRLEGARQDPRRARRQGPCRLRFGQVLQRGSLSFPEARAPGFGTNNVDHCTRLCHASSVAALLEGVGSGAVSAPFTDAMKDSDVIVVIGARPGEPPGRRDLFQAGREERAPS
jgi:formate dehydrogenase major subunit